MLQQAINRLHGVVLVELYSERARVLSEVVSDSEYRVSCVSSTLTRLTRLLTVFLLQ